MNVKSLIATATIALFAAFGAHADTRTDYSNVEVEIQSDRGTERVQYEELTSTEQALARLTLERAHRYAQGKNPNLEPLAVLLAGDGRRAKVGCGFNSTESEWIQFGCWSGGQVCYGSFGEDGVDFGCHECNGENCPTE
ncbi:MAG: hypothetical protein AAF493_27620 [Pseudomonadota bacterium]